MDYLALLMIAMQAAPQTLPDLGQLTREYGATGVLIWLAVALTFCVGFLARALLASNSEWRQQLRQDAAEQLKQSGLLTLALAAHTEAIRANTRETVELRMELQRSNDRAELRFSKLEALCSRSGA